jgi:iron-regulated ABC superfamily ATP binding cassette transporter
MSRGFSRDEAKSLIVKARLIPVIDKIPDEKIKQDLLEELKLKMLK